jgi:uncharacterized membrane protein
MPEDMEELRRRIAELTERVQRLEALVDAGPHNEVPGAERPIAPTASPMSGLPAGGGGQRAAGATPAQPPTLESRIGSQWFNRIGIIAVLIGIALFLKYAFENNWVGVGGRVAIGLLLGCALVLWSERFRRRGYVIFSWSLKAVGIGTLYLSLWAGFQIYGLFPAGTAFAGMVLVTTLTAALALLQEAQILGVLALAGGFAAPLLLSTGQNHELAVFTYVTVLDLATLAVIALRPWTRLLAASLIGTVVLYVAWYAEFYTLAQLGWTVSFASLFFVLFAAGPTLAIPTAGVNTGQSSSALIFVAVVNAAAYFLEAYLLLDTVNRPALAGIAVGLTAIYLGLSRRLQTLCRKQPHLRKLQSIHVVLAIAFLTLAAPLALDSIWITVAWLIETALLLCLARSAASSLLKLLAAIPLLLAIGRLVLYDRFRTERLFFNPRFLLYGVALVVLAFGISLAGHASRGDTRHIQRERVAMAIAIVLFNMLALLALNLEVRDCFQRDMETMRAMLGGPVLPGQQARHFTMLRDYSYSAVAMGYGAVLMWAGFWKRSPFLRWQALILLAITVAKVFTYDAAQLDLAYRIASFIALGVLLLAVSFLYQRDWLRLPLPERPSATRRKS